MKKEIIGFHVDDSLKDWVNDRDDTFFLKNDSPLMLSAYRKMAAWAVGKEGDPYVRPAIDTFLASADMWLIAYAQLYGFTIVTQERPSGSPKYPRDQISKTKIKIPDVCRFLDIPCINIHELLKRSGVKLVLGGGFSGFPDDAVDTSEEEALWDEIDEFNERAPSEPSDEFDD